MGSILTVVSEADTQDLTTLAAVKRELGIATSDTDKDDQIEAWIEQWSSFIAAYCNRSFGLETVSEQFRSVLTGGVIALSRRPVVSVTSVAEDATTVDAGDYEVDSASGILSRLSSDAGSDWATGKITVVYVAGYELVDDLPKGIERAAIELVKQSYFGATRDPMVMSEDVVGIGRTQYKVGGMSAGDALPSHVKALLDPYRQLVFA